MEELTIQLSVEQEIRIWKKYLQFERAKGKRGIWQYGIGIAIGLTLTLLGLASSLFMLTFTGIILMTGSFIVIAVFFIRFKLLEGKIVTYLTEAIKIDPVIYFSFDEASIRIRTTNTEVTFQWAKIERSNENQGDIYLYDSHNQPWCIISEEKIGAEEFQRFKGLLDREMSLKTTRK